MGCGSILWSEVPDQPDDETTPDTEAHGVPDETSPEHRLRRWLKAMFGGERHAEETDES